MSRGKIVSLSERRRRIEAAARDVRTYDSREVDAAFDAAREDAAGYRILTDLLEFTPAARSRIMAGVLRALNPGRGA